MHCPSCSPAHVHHERHPRSPPLQPTSTRWSAAAHHDPFSLLGLHRDGAGLGRCAYSGPTPPTFRCAPPAGFEPAEQRTSRRACSHGAAPKPPPQPVRAAGRANRAGSARLHDPYAFAPAIERATTCTCSTKAGSSRPIACSAVALETARWRQRRALRRAGRRTRERVSVVGDFNRWDGRVHPMAVHGLSGVWELFIPGLDRRHAVQVRDPQPRQRRSLRQDRSLCARFYELRPGTAARVLRGRATSGATRNG